MAIILAIINVILFRDWTIKMGNAPKKSGYLFQKLEKKGLGIKNFMSIYLIVNQFVPLDLLVVLEISKLIYTGVMEDDV
jgi:magnesium-transporting ATPase (P-type)